MNRHESDNGFTVIELVMVTVVMGILLTVAVVGLSQNSQRASKEASLSVADRAKIQLGSYYSARNRYPVNKADAVSYIQAKDEQLATEFADDAKYTYSAVATDGSACEASGAVKCERYTLTVNAVQAWGGNAEDSVTLRP